MRGHQYTDEETQWVRDNSGLTYNVMAEEFNRRFDASITGEALRNMVKRRNLFTKRIGFTQEQKDWIKANITNCPYNELTKKFNERFGTNHVAKTILYFAHNQQMKNNLKPGFKPGGPSPNRVPIGSERKDNQYLIVKTAMPDVWRQKHIAVWEAANGPIPKKHKIMFKDGDTQNCELDNLILCDKRHSIIWIKYGISQRYTTPEIEETKRVFAEFVMAKNAAKRKKKR